MNDKLKEHLLLEHRLTLLVDGKKEKLFSLVDEWYGDWVRSNWRSNWRLSSEQAEAKYRDIFSKVIAFGRIY